MNFLKPKFWDYKKPNFVAFLLLPFNEGKLWYWGLSTDKDIVWYPSILPIRQESLNDWDSCLDKLYKEFQNYL